MSQNEQALNDGAVVQVEEVLVQTTGAGALSLPLTHVCQGLLEGYLPGLP